MAIVLEDLHLNRISRKRPVCPGPARECVGARHSFCPLHLRLSGTLVLCGVLGLWRVGGELFGQAAIAYFRQVVETLCVIPRLVASAYSPLTPKTTWFDKLVREATKNGTDS